MTRARAMHARRLRRARWRQILWHPSLVTLTSFALAVAGLLIVITPPAAVATTTTYFWDGGGGSDTKWSNRFNWVGDVVPTGNVSIGIVATPPGSAQDAADRLVAAGVTSILNFAPVLLNVPATVSVRKVDLAVELQILSYYEQRRAAAAERIAQA